MRTVALLYYYRVRNFLRFDNPLSVFLMFAVFSMFCWGMIWYLAADWSVQLVESVFALIPVPFLFLAGSISSLRPQERVFMHSAEDRNSWVSRMIKLRVSGLAAAATAVLLSGIVGANIALLILLFSPASQFTPRETEALMADNSTEKPDTISGLLSRVRIAPNHLGRAVINAAGISAAFATGILVFVYQDQVEAFPFVAMILLNGLWTLVIASAAEVENYAMPVLAGLRINRFIVLRLQDYTMGIIAVAVSSSISAFLFSGWSGIFAAGIPLFLTIYSICVCIRFGSLNLPRFVLFGCIYAGISAATYHSVASGLLILVFVTAVSYTQAKHHYKERVLDHAQA